MRFRFWRLRYRLCVIFFVYSPPFFLGRGGGICIIDIYRNVGADFYVYLAALGFTEAEFKSLPLVDRSTIHLNFGKLAMSVAGLVETPPTVALFEDEEIP